MKIGIITHFYKSINYGGILQSFALTKKLINLGYNPEQLCYVMSLKNLDKQCFSVKGIVIKFYILIKRAFRLNSQHLKDKSVDKTLKSEAFDEWSKKYINQSTCIYTKKNIKKSVDKYDVFITGSDQVWNYSWYDKNFFLSFVPKRKKKIAYAASIGHSQLYGKQRKIFKRHLKTFDAVSVREKDAVQLIKDISPVGANWVLDPVFLLEKEEWLKVASPNQIKGKYVFCYFLHNNPKQMTLAEEYAKNMGLKIVFIADMFKEIETSFGDIRIENAGPGQFLSLISCADVVFTDSFHASAFSCIFEKNFFVFGRNDAKGMNKRIESLITLFECEDRFCDSEEKQNLNYIVSVKTNIRNKELKKFKDMLIRSEEFLQNSIGRR